MSGGTFDYKDDTFRYEVIDSLKAILERYKAHRRGINVPNSSEWEVEFAKSLSNETMSKMEEGLQVMKMAYVYATRIDYLLASDDDEESFHRRLKHDLAVASVKEEEITDELFTLDDDEHPSARVFRIYTQYAEVTYACGYEYDDDGDADIVWMTIYSIETKPEYRRQGHASVLIDYLKDEYYGEIGSTVTLNDAATALMKKHNVKTYNGEND